MKGAFRLRPTRSKYSEIWNVGDVLTQIKSWGKNESLDNQTLVKKLTFLLAICSPRRISELAQLDISETQRDSERWTFFLQYRNKNRKSGPAHTATYESFSEEPILCPLRNMVLFLNRTKELRSNQTKLLISPHSGRPVTPSTVARWIKEVLERCGVDAKYTAHSTRSAATSAAAARGLPIGKIMEAGCWAKSSQVFKKHYLKDQSQQASFQKTILRRSDINKLSLYS